MLTRCCALLLSIGLLVSSASTAGGAQAVKVLKLAHQFSETHPVGLGAKLFKETVEQKTDGRLQVNVFPAQQLGKIGDVEVSLRLGTIDIATSSANLLSNIYEPLSVFSFPYSFREDANVARITQSDVYRDMLADMANTAKIRVLTTYREPARHMTANKPINSVADVKGLKLRIPPTPSWVAFWKKLGASPTPISWGEVYTSLQLGVVDAQENPFVTILSANLQEVQKYLILTSHIVLDMDFLIMNADTFKNLSKQFQDAVLEGGDEMAKYVTKNFHGQTEGAFQTLVAKGMIVIKPDIQSFVTASKGFPEEYLKATYVPLFKKLQEVQ
jgi:tripartite ATP-independent transporter DctP family solute receptor